MGFANSVIGGAAALIRAAIKSPNFVSGSAGWQIAKDGTAEFNSLTARGTITGATLTGSTLIVTNSHGATVITLNYLTSTFLMYADTGSATQGALIVSLSPGGPGTDQFGNTFQSGMAVYTVIAGTTYAVQLGQATVAGSPTPGLFLVNETGSAPHQPPVYSFANASSTGTAAVIDSGQATAGSADSFIEVADSTLSGVPGGAIVLSAGNITVDAGGNLTMGNNLTLTPKMATPANTAAVKAGTATLAQAEACLGGLIQSMQNRGMVT
jgi:hypothetical protein